MILIAFLAVVYHLSFSQNYTNILTSSSELTVRGTSSLHDWESRVTLEEINLKVIVDDPNPLLLKSISLNIPAKSIKSGKSLMDKKTYTALKADDYPIIYYESQDFQLISSDSLLVNGKLTVRGISRALPVRVSYQFNVNTRQFNFDGSVIFKMSDFEVEPPTAMMGTIKTGDEITVKFNLNINNNS